MSSGFSTRSPNIQEKPLLLNESNVLNNEIKPNNINIDDMSEENYENKIKMEENINEIKNEININLDNKKKNRKERMFTPMKISGKINNQESPIIIDTGASISVIDHEFYKELNSKLPISKIEKVITDAQGNKLNVVGKVMLFLSIGMTKFKVKLYVINNLSNSVIIGNDYLQKWGITIDYKQGFIWTDKRSFFKFNVEEDYSTCGELIYTIEDLKIPPRSNMFINGFIKCHPSGRFANTTDEIIIEQLDRDNKQYLITRSLCKTTINPIINIVNFLETPLFVKKGTPIAVINSNPNDKIMNINLNDKNENNNISNKVEYNINSEINDDQKLKLRALLDEFADVFDENISSEYTTLGEHSINTRDALPTKVIYNRNSYTENDVIKKEIENMLKLNIIRPSKSEWTAPVVLVKKKDGSIRFCVDFRKLNDATQKEIYPLPRINDTIDSLTGMKYFTTLDFISGYWQINIKESDRHKTAFNTKFGSYEFNRMPFGLSNAPYTFQRIMDIMLTGFKWINCLVYLDDIIIFSTTFDQHLTDIASILNVIRNAKLKLKSKKCQFGFNRINYLGHVISDKGIEIDNNKIKSINRIKRLYSVKEVKSFLGLASYYRRFIKDFSVIAYPLNVLTSKDNLKFNWNKSAQDALDELKLKLCTTPILSYPDFRREFIIQTDACKYGFGAVLSQNIDGLEHVISYFSRTTSKQERNYDSREAECAAIIAGVKHFRSYLFGVKFKIITDHQALKYLQTSKHLSSKFTRWSLFLQDYDFEIIYREARKHKNADALSRLTFDKIEKIESEINYLNDKLHIIESNSQMVDQIVNNDNNDNDDMENLLKKDIKQLQNSDPFIKQYIDYIKYKILSDDQTNNINIITNCNFMIIENDLLYHLYHPSKNKKKRNYLRKRLVVPNVLITTILDYYHDYELAGHLGFEKTYLKIRDRYYWNNMYNDIKNYVNSCDVCSSFNNRYLNEQELQIIKSEYPWQVLVMDFEGPLPLTQSSNKYLLIITDHFTNYIEAFPVDEITSKVTAKILFNNIFCKYGSPEKIISDRGTHFTANVIVDLCQMMKTQKEYSSSYHPQTNGKVERFNRTILSMLAKYCGEYNDRWDVFINQLVFAYNTSKNSSTGESPYCMLFGREAKTPMDVITQSNNITIDITDEYVINLKENLAKIWKIANINREVHCSYNIKYHNENKTRKEKITKYKVGMKVLIFFPQIPIDKNRKFYSKWKGPYEIIKLEGLNCEARNCLNEDEITFAHLSRLKPYYDPVDFTIKNNNINIDCDKKTINESDSDNNGVDDNNDNINNNDDENLRDKNINQSEDKNDDIEDDSLDKKDNKIENDEVKGINNNDDKVDNKEVQNVKDNPRTSTRTKKPNKFLQDFVMEKNNNKNRNNNDQRINNNNDQRNKKNKNIKLNSKNKHIEGKDYEVETILRMKIEDGKKFYFVKFKGYTNRYNLWLPEENLNCTELLYKFERTQI